MAYKMAPKGGNTAKTGHGIPMTFRQDGPKQMEFIKNVGSRISKANDAGQKAYDASRKSASFLGDFGGGSGVKRSYEKNPVEYVKGFVGNIMSGEDPKPKPKAKTKPKGPMQKKKEKGFLETAGDYASNTVDKIGSAISNANEAGQKAYDASRKSASFLGDFGGGSGTKRSYEKNPVEYVKGFVGNIMSGESPKPKVKPKVKAKPKGPMQVSKGAFKKPTMTSTKTGPKASKKAPTKMKNC